MNVDAREDIDVRMLEELFNQDHCEINHAIGTPKGTPCLHTPVAVRTFKCQTKTYKMCLNAVKTTMQKLHPSYRGYCTHCGEPTNECWGVEPL